MKMKAWQFLRSVVRMLIAAMIVCVLIVLITLWAFSVNDSARQRRIWQIQCAGAGYPEIREIGENGFCYRVGDYGAEEIVPVDSIEAPGVGKIWRMGYDVPA